MTWPDAPAQIPTFVRTGPYGPPMALRPPGHPRLAASRVGPAIPELPLATPGRAAADPKPVLGARKNSAGDVHLWGDEEDGLPPVRPGTVGRGGVKLPEAVPDPTGKARRTALTPDYEVPLGPKTSIGGFGEVGKVQIDPQAGLLPSVKARDVTGGVTLQYRFGQ
ncbi:hypothetical protein [uncultured Enterovirga sp.]|uniref:hypothetical protein n=1 Tax=uncultured Enterovirga sp. TaxID=2026352 RepID=UPI0035CA148C